MDTHLCVMPDLLSIWASTNHKGPRKHIHHFVQHFGRTRGSRATSTDARMSKSRVVDASLLTPSISVYVHPDDQCL